MTLCARDTYGAFIKRVAGFGLLIIASLAAFTPVTPAAAQSNKVRLGYQCSLWGAPAVVALELDLFKTHGIEVEATHFGAGKDARDELVSNNLDVATVGCTPFVVGAIGRRC